MNKKMKKLVILGLSTILAMGTLVGCRGNSTEKNGDVHTVHVWSGDGAALSTWEGLVDEFNKTIGKEKGIEIEWTHQTDGQMTEIAKQNGQLPEICGTFSNNMVEELLKNGELLAFDDIEGGREFVDAHGTPLKYDSNYYNDKVYSIYNSTMTAGLIYNKDLFKAAGIVDENGEAKSPKTTEEIIEYAQKITNIQEGVYGYCIPLKFDTSYCVEIPMRTAFGTAVYDFDTLTVDNDFARNGWKFVFDLKEAGVMFPAVESLDNDTARAYFAEGKIGMMTAISWDVGVLTTQFVADCDWGVIPFPAPAGQEMKTPWSSLSGGYYMTKNATKIPTEKVLEVMKFIYSDKTELTFYENNITVPIRKEILEKADESKLIPQFKDFAACYDGETGVEYWVPLKVENPKNWNIIDVWNGTADYTLDEYFDYIEENKNNAFKKGAENGTIDVKLLRQRMGL